MKDTDFTQCDFINKNMNYTNYLDFCNNCYAIKELYKELDHNGKRFYKWYVYANIYMDILYKDRIWEFLNVDEPMAFIELINMRKAYMMRYKH